MNDGEHEAAGRLLPLVYEELRKLAASRMARERAGQTLQPTALVHEAWLKLGGEAQADWQNRGHFFSAAAEAMRRILVDRARRRSRARHGGDVELVSLDAVDVAAPLRDEDSVLRVHEALVRLEAVDPRKADLVKLRYFVGLSFSESAAALGIAVPTAKQWWSYARAFLSVELAKE